MKTSQVLQRVWVHLGDGRQDMAAHRRFICHAIQYLYYVVAVIGDGDRTRTLKLIRSHLDGAASLEHWLAVHHDIEISYKRPYIRKIMTTRKAWLEHLIQHYQSKGD